jgi:hypothetical protein
MKNPAGVMLTPSPNQRNIALQRDNGIIKTDSAPGNRIATTLRNCNLRPEPQPTSIAGSRHGWQARPLAATVRTRGQANEETGTRAPGQANPGNRAFRNHVATISGPASPRPPERRFRWGRDWQGAARRWPEQDSIRRWRQSIRHSWDNSPRGRGITTTTRTIPCRTRVVGRSCSIAGRRSGRGVAPTRGIVPGHRGRRRSAVGQRLRRRPVRILRPGRNLEMRLERPVIVPGAVHPGRHRPTSGFGSATPQARQFRADGEPPRPETSIGVHRCAQQGDGEHGEAKQSLHETVLFLVPDRQAGPPHEVRPDQASKDSLENRPGPEKSRPSRSVSTRRAPAHRQKCGYRCDQYPQPAQPP